MTPPFPEDPEQKARRQIDAMLVASGWAVQDRVAMNLAAAPGVAIREFQTSAGPKALPVPVAPLAEQHRIVAEVERRRLVAIEDRKPSNVG